MAKQRLPVNGGTGRARAMAKGEKKRAMRGRAGRMQGGRGSGRAGAGQVRLWGRHAVEAALKNPERQHRKLWATRDGIDSLDGELPADFPVEYADAHDLARLVARDAPHQGLVLECAPLSRRHTPFRKGHKCPANLCGQVAEWLKAADCKSARASVRWFESSPVHHPSRFTPIPIAAKASAQRDEQQEAVERQQRADRA